MKLKQLSIFLENAPGRLYEATHALGEAGINLRSLCISDSSDFGVLRILVSDVGKARRVIMEKQLPARIYDVVAVEIDDTPGSLARSLCPLHLSPPTPRAGIRSRTSACTRGTAFLPASRWP